MSLTYRDSGVDIDEGDALVERIKPHARRTMRPEILAGIGGFGGLFELPKGYAEPAAEALTVLLEPTRIYVKDCLALRDALDVHAFAHITGGGLPGNLPRVLPAETRAVLQRGWPEPAIFARLREQVAPDEMLRTF